VNGNVKLRRAAARVANGPNIFQKLLVIICPSANEPVYITLYQYGKISDHHVMAEKNIWKKVGNIFQ